MIRLFFYTILSNIVKFATVIYAEYEGKIQRRKLVLSVHTPHRQKCDYYE